MITTIKLNNTIPIKTYARQQRYTVSFKSDVFEPSIKSLFGNLDEETISSIEDAIKSRNTIGSGFSSDIFRLNNFIIKVPKIPIDGKQLGEEQLNQNLCEYNILKKIEEIGQNITAKAHDVIEHKGLYYLVEDFIDGIHPDENRFEDIHLKDLLGKFALLDQHGIENCDLHSGNIFLLKNGETRLIDFGVANVITNKGISREANFLQSKKLLESEMTAPYKERFLRSFFYSYINPSHGSDNPHLNICSNTSNFEFRSIYSRLKNKEDSNPLEFFRNYLQNKGKIYHSNMEKFLKFLNIEDVILPTDSDWAIEEAKSKLQKAIRYEELAQHVFKNPNDDLLKVELAKLQVKTFFGFDDLGSKIPNKQKVKSACSQLISLLEKNIETSEGMKKEYFEETLEKWKKEYFWTEHIENSVDIPDNENLIKILFEQNKPIDKTTNKLDNITNAIKTNKKICLLVAGCLSIVGVGSIYLHKRKKSNKQVESNVQKQSQINNVNPKDIVCSNNVSNIFSNF